MGDQLVVVESEEQARAIIAERLRKQEIERSAEQVSGLLALVVLTREV